MNKGFTLIELLAVIVIISIISVITITIVTDVVQKSKNEFNEDQQLLVEKAAELWGTDNMGLLPSTEVPCKYITLGDLKDNGYIGDNVSDINSMKKLSDDMKISIVVNSNNDKLTYQYDSTPDDTSNCEYVYAGPKYTITFDTMGGTEIASIRVTEGEPMPRPANPQKQGYRFSGWLLNGEPYDFNTLVTESITLTATYGQTEQYIMITGQEFNKAVKSLAKGSTVSSYSTSDNIVEHIEFYSNGELPNGFTLSQLQALPSTVVSSTGETIKAYYNSSSKSIYVYSDGEIVWNSDSRYSFSHFKKLSTLEIPYNVTSIGDYTFFSSYLTSITLSSSVTSIGNYAFYNSGLTSITIPNSVTSIGTYAFYNNAITSLAIPRGLTSIEGSAFVKNNLVSITVDPNNTVYEDRNSNAIIKKATNQLVIGSSNTIIPNSVTSIGNNAFYGNSNLTAITIPSSVTSIGGSAFENTALTSIIIPSSVTYVGNRAFSISSLVSITVDPNNTVYEDRNSNAIIKKTTNELVIGCKNTTIPNTVTSIGNYAFYNSGLTSITIPSSVTSIGNIAFGSNSNLTSITIPSSVTSIGNYAFSDCTKLTSITFASPTGWWYADSASATSGTSVDLSDASQNVTYFKTTYSSKYWKKS